MITALLLLAGYIPSTPMLGVTEGRCAGNERGPAIIVTVEGLRDRAGELKLEAYPANDKDFLADDNVLIMAGKVFRRAYLPVPKAGPVELCIRVPSPGAYSLALLHDRNMNHRFNLSSDGIGFSNNPRLGFGRPSAAATRFIAGRGISRTAIILNYRRGFTFGPLRR